MATKSKSTWGQRFRVRAKILAPVGITLTQGETVALADIYDDDVKKIKQNRNEVEKAVEATTYKHNESAIEKSLVARNTASAIYKRTKSPIKKREWARRIVIADHTLKSMRDMRKRMTTAHDRLEMIKGDLELQLIEAEARAAEARAYAQAGKQLRLAGEKLIDARARAKSVKLEYTNLEVSMEGAEKMIDNTKPEELIETANKIVGITR